MGQPYGKIYVLIGTGIVAIFHSDYIHRRNVFLSPEDHKYTCRHEGNFCISQHSESCILRENEHAIFGICVPQSRKRVALSSYLYLKCFKL